MRGLYGGIAGTVVGVLLARHDLHDTLALLRGARTGQPAPDRLAAVMGVGALDQRAAADIAAAPDGATAVLRLAAHRLPDPLTARALPAAWERYELNGDPDEFETTVAAAAIDGWTDRLERVGRAARPVLELVQAECDRANLLAVLRDPALETPRLLPAGLVTRAGVAGRPARRSAARSWPRAPAGEQPSNGTSATETSPRSNGTWTSALWRQAVRGLRRGDPLGADVPVGYVLAAECEARTVRLLLAGTAPGSRRHETCSSR